MERNKAHHMTEDHRPFGIKDQVGYMLGYVGGSFVNLYVDGFVLTFATYVLGVSPFFMSMLFLGARIWDAFTDVMMGQIPDRYRIGNSGNKYKPYIRIAKWPLAISGVMVFTNVSNLAPELIMVWIAMAYVFYGMAYTAASIPYGAMATVISRDPVHRTKLSRARSIGGMVVGIGALTFVPILTFDDAGSVLPNSFFYIAIAFGILSILAYIGLDKLTVERVREETKSTVNRDYRFKDALRSLPKNRPLMGVMVASVGSLIQITAQNQLGVILFNEYYNNPQAQALNNLINVLVIVVLVIAVPKLVGRFGKKNLVVTGTSVSLLVAIFLFFVPIQNVYWFIAIYNLGMSGMTLFTIVVWAIVTDALDYNELITRKRYDGTLYSVYTFSRKVGSALASTVASFGLGAIGFVSGIESQTAQVSQNIRYLFMLMPIISGVLMLVGMGLIYNLNNEKTNRMYDELDDRHNT